MKKKRYTEEQVVRILGEIRSGKSIAETGRQYGVSEQTIYRWRAKFPGHRNISGAGIPDGCWMEFHKIDYGPG